MSKDTDLRHRIQQDLYALFDGEIRNGALQLLATLGYKSQKYIPIPASTADGFRQFLKANGGGTINDARAMTDEWKSIDFLFQFTNDELAAAGTLFSSAQVGVLSTLIESYLFFAIDLKGDNYTRTKLAEITREINKAFPMPAMIIFRHGGTITFSIIDRRVHKREESKDVLGKVTLIKDIRLDEPHRAHIDILADLAIDNLRSPKNWVELHKEWQRVLDTKELNKKFFQELANWYFWAVQWVKFPDDEEKNQEVLKATSVIRLITRFIFVWFLKEKGLVSPKLFDEDYLEGVLKYSDDSCYYKAILQNLFFATLNSEMGTRKFISDGSGGRNSQHFVHNVFRYKNEFKDPEKAVKELFEPIPFLNGGLFECLDKEIEVDGEKKTVRVDGFSQNKKNPLYVPDDLFFNEEDYADLSDVYDDKRKSNVKVRGLINILDSYKFTVAENTPVEEEVALDPELLGRVFENLLANYNPETKTTARKQTGSFYTPREIVNYMVDESLIAYLKQKLQTETEGFTGFIAFDEDQTTMFGNEARIQQKFETPVAENTWKGKEEELEPELRNLFSYDSDENPFNETETEILIKAIDNCKILDPACGSGAFPMGVLHRLVHLLGKLDPNNDKWREWQRQKAIRETEEAYKIGDHKERETRLLEINDVFENNASDYGRKLFLIENCIYGVDIQPIAIQIAKLRFFISLVVDEIADAGKKNLGILPLPNLETKFVAANTLIGLETQRGLKPVKVNELEKQLKEVRARHFSARTRKTKEKYREKDKTIRCEIAELLKQGGIRADVADQIAEWNPYDQNATAHWFDAEYMFGVENRFDVIVGNPPYVNSRSMSRDDLALREKIQRSYSLTKGSWDIYIAFFEKSFEILSAQGTLAYITPDKWISRPFGNELRIFATERLMSLFKAGRGVFESSNVDAVVTIYVGSRPPLLQIYDYIDDEIKLLTRIDKSTLESPYPYDWLFTRHAEMLLKIERNALRLRDLGTCENACATDDAYRLRELIEECSEASPSGGQMLMVNTGTIGKYVPRWGEREMVYLGSRYLRPVVNRERFLTEFPRSYGQKSVREKVILKGLNLLDACLDPQGTMIPGIPTLVVFANERSDLKILMAIINSPLALFYIKEKYPGSSYNQGITFTKDMINELPIPSLDEGTRRKLVALVDDVLAAKNTKCGPEANTLEKEIDGLLYSAYGMEASDISIIEHASSRKKVKDDDEIN